MRAARSSAFRALIEANASLWAGEEEVFRRYWASPDRSASTDAVWLGRQCYKEIYDGVLPRLGRLEAALGSFSAPSRSGLGDLLEDAETEYAHFLAFALAHDTATGEEGSVLDGPTLAALDWPENARLGRCRRRHREEFGDVGHRAQLVTEGGYCTLYRSGAELGGSPLDEAISRACRQVYEDEFDHLLSGVADLDDGSWSAAEWDQLTELTVEQSRLRIEMRNAQFGGPIAAEEIRRFQAGSLPPIEFDFERAGAAYG